MDDIPRSVPLALRSEIREPVKETIYRHGLLLLLHMIFLS